MNFLNGFSTLEFRKKGFAWDTLQLGSGTALAQVVLILTMPILSRIFPIDAFGVAALFSAIVLLISSVAGLRYDLAILLPLDDAEGYCALLLNLLLALMVGLTFGLLIFLLRHQLAAWLNAPHLAGYLWFSGPAIVIFGIVNGLNYWCTRMVRYALLASSKVLSNIITVAVQLLAGFFGMTSAGFLITGNVIGRIAENSFLFRCAWTGFPKAHFKGKKLFPLMFNVAQRYRKFPIYNTWATLVNTASWMIPSFLLSFYFNTTVVGFYAAGDRVIRTPMNIIGRSIAQVFFQRGAAAFREGALGQLFLDTIRLLVRIGLLPILCLSILGKEIFSVFLGARWAEAGVYVQILALWSFVWFLTSPTSTILSIVEKQEKSLIFNLVNFATRIISLIIGGMLKSPRLALVLFAITGLLTYGGLLLWISQSAGVSWKKLIRSFNNREFFFSTALALLLLALKFIIFVDWILVLSAILAIACYYGYLLLRFKHLFHAPISLQ